MFERLYNYLEDVGFVGVDASVEVSLGEYNLVWKLEDDGSYTIIAKNHENKFNVHWNCNVKEALDYIKEWDDNQESWNNLLDYIGDDNPNEDIYLVSDAISYFGVDNVLSYRPIGITDLEMLELIENTYKVWGK